MKTLNKKSILLICIAIVFAFMLVLSSCKFSIKNQDTSSDANNGYIYTIIDGVGYAIKDNEAMVVTQPENIVSATIHASVTHKGTSYSVTSISPNAFKDCNELISVVIPNSVTSIGEGAFYKCNRLAEIVIPSSVTSIGEGAFLNCNRLAKIVIPSSVTSIEKRAFYGCGRLTSIMVDENNEYYKSIDGNLYSKDGKTLIQYAMGKDNTHFEIPNSVTEIGTDAFTGCQRLTSIVIPDSVTSLGIHAFWGCNNLTIYCEAESKPSWDDYWNRLNIPVVWGHEHSYENGECVCGMKQE